MADAYETYEFIADDLRFRDEDILAFRVVESVSGIRQTLPARPPVFALNEMPSAPPALSPFQDRDFPHLEPSLGLPEGPPPPFYFWIRVQRAGVRSHMRVSRILHKAASLTIGRGADSRTFHGEIFRARHLSGASQARAAYDLFVYPWIWSLAFSRKSRVWSGSILDVLDQIVDDYPDAVKSRAVVNTAGLKTRPRNHEYLIQHNESDYNFINRHFEREGIFYYIAHEPAGYQVVLGQDNGHFRVGQLFGRRLALSEGRVPTGNEPADVVSDLVYEAQTVPQQYVTRDYNPRNAGARLQGKAPTIDHAQQVFQYPGMFDELLEGADRVSPRRNRAQQSHRLLATGASRSQFIAAGEEVVLPYDLEWGTPSEFADSSFFIRQVVHDMVRHARDGLEQPDFSNVFEAQKLEFQYSPSQLTPYPELNTAQIAVVETAAPGQQVDVDQFNRPLVSFKWDNWGTKVRLRLAQGWAGGNHGMQVLPRVGDEVLVAYVDDHPDRPVIVASLYNSRNRMPFEPSRSGEFSELSKASGPHRRLTGISDAGGNRVFMFDDQGAERLVTTAGRDRDDMTANRWTTASYQTVEYVHDAKLEQIGGGYTLTIEGDTKVVIKGDVDVKILGSFTFTHE
ncbi:type VI secretion system Vgr family protein [Marinibaculum pumilum]|uniref:Type VI secretion system Vgr family protein n=1 Tax=Marinibaculum pumilum TaxID=1766165 RepID=A0ABV7KWW7_9PROT